MMGDRRETSISIHGQGGLFYVFFKMEVLGRRPVGNRAERFETGVAAKADWKKKYPVLRAIDLGNFIDKQPLKIFYFKK